MTGPDTTSLAPLVSRLRLWQNLDAGDEAAIMALPHSIRPIRANEFIVRQDDRPANCCLVLSGFAIRHKIVGSGARQIFSIHLSGDLVDLHNSFLGVADHNVQALTAVVAAFIPAEAVLALAFERPSIGKALWHDTLVDAAIFREWTLNVGRRDGRMRMAHMLCEFALRLAAAELGDKQRYTLPMTQEQLADALALTSIHVNRILKGLREEGVIDYTNRTVTIADFERLAKVGDFDSSYLHLALALEPTVVGR